MSTTEVKATNERARRYWLSLDEYERPDAAAAVTKGEFLAPPELALEADRLGMNRRNFLKLMGASAVMTSMAGCARRPVQTIVPYVNKPVEITHGVANYYASNDPVTGCGLVLTAREGRPLKVDGNDGHPINGHGLSASGQASVLDLYDPDRLRMPMIDGKTVSFADFDKATAPLVKPSGVVNSRPGLYFLTGTVHSPALQRALAAFGARHFMFDALPFDDIRTGQKESYGKAVMPIYRIERARVIVAIDADFLDTMLSPEEFTRKFAAGRRLDGSGYARLVSFESAMRLTGQNADLRVAIHPNERLGIALALAYEVAKRTGRSAAELEGFAAEQVAGRFGIPADAITSTAEALVKNRGRSLVLAGGVGGKGTDAVALQNVVNFINSALDNDGATVEASAHSSNQAQGSYEDLQKLVQAMNAGAVGTLVIQGINPIYNLPSALGFGKALKKVENVIYFGRYNDETAREAKYVVAESHPFETWGDVNPWTGLYGVVQPTIRPLFETRSLLDQLVAWGQVHENMRGVASSYEAVRAEARVVFGKSGAGGDFESIWESLLQAGFHDFADAARDRDSGARNYQMGALARAARAAKEVRPEAEDSFTLVLQPTVALRDGSQANNAQLQELPDPVSKVTWTNYLAIAPETAKRLGLKDGDVVQIENSSYKAELPVLRQPGLRANVAVSQIGYGRQMGGRVADGVGVALTEFVQPLSGGLAFLAPNVKLTKTGKFQELALTQEHHSLEGRDIVFETTYDDFKKNPQSGIVHHVEKLDSMWSGHEYKGYRWGMTIDLNRCTGCSACVLACSVENNVPVVGVEEVRRGREMHWIRIDRYYKGTPENPQTVLQPMTCQHCENAPCETVCPVLATMHNDEGLNQMVYNRCVGTRYCSNNCPYKVRRFNFFESNQDMNGKFEHPIALSKNPEVTLRSRGVMEKCTFCVQRIESGKNVAKREGRKVKDGEIQTACQVACPADAIVFGDINDPASAVSKLRKNPRGYTVLEELNTKPSITYLTRVWNRAPAAEAAHGETTGGGH